MWHDYIADSPDCLIDSTGTPIRLHGDGLINQIQENNNHSGLFTLIHRSPLWVHKAAYRPIQPPSTVITSPET